MCSQHFYRGRSFTVVFWPVMPILAGNRLLFNLLGPMAPNYKTNYTNTFLCYLLPIHSLEACSLDHYLCSYTQYNFGSLFSSRCHKTNSVTPVTLCMFWYIGEEAFQGCLFQSGFRHITSA